MSRSIIFMRSILKYRKLFYVLLVCLSGVSVTVLEVLLFSHRSDQAPADAAIVLGAAVFDNKPSPVFEERIRHAVDLYHQKQVRMLVMTGGLGAGDHLSEAEAARQWSMDHGVPGSAIVTETQSRTTRENLIFAQPLLAQHQLKRVLLVSDPLHMRRSIAMARQLGMDAYPSPTPTTRYTGWKSWSGFLLRESYYLTRCRLAGHC